MDNDKGFIYSLDERETQNGGTRVGGQVVVWAGVGSRAIALHP